MLDCVDDEALQILCSGKLKLRFLDLSQSGITDKRYSQSVMHVVVLRICCTVSSSLERAHLQAPLPT